MTGGSRPIRKDTVVAPAMHHKEVHVFERYDSARVRWPRYSTSRVRESIATEVLRLATSEKAISLGVCGVPSTYWPLDGLVSVIV